MGVLVYFSFVLSSCIGTGIKRESRDQTNLKWRIGFSECQIEAEQRSIESATLTAALLGMAVDYIVNSIRGAINEAAKDKENKYEANFADYMLGKQKEPRACLLIGYGYTNGFGRSKIGKISVATIDRFMNSKGNEWTHTIDAKAGISNAEKVLVEDLLNLEFIKKPIFLMEIDFVKSRDLTAVRPEINYVYYPTRIESNKKEEDSFVIGVDVDFQ